MTLSPNEAAGVLRDMAAVETGGEFAGVGIDIVDVTDVAVVDLLLVVVLDLHHLVGGGNAPRPSCNTTV